MTSYLINGTWQLFINSFIYQVPGTVARNLTLLFKNLRENTGSIQNFKHTKRTLDKEKQPEPGAASSSYQQQQTVGEIFADTRRYSQRQYSCPTEEKFTYLERPWKEDYAEFRISKI